MTVKMKYKGRNFNSGASLAKAIEQDMQREIERSVRKAANASGAQITKTSRGYEIQGTAQQMDCFGKRFR